MNYSDNYHPQLCGDCKKFVYGPKARDEFGRCIGLCLATREEVTRTDWCHDPSQIDLKNEAMQRYYAYMRQKEYESTVKRRNKRAAAKGGCGGAGDAGKPVEPSRRSDRGVGRTGGYTKHGDRSV